MTVKAADILYDDLLYDSTVNGNVTDLHQLFGFVDKQQPHAPRRYDDATLLLAAVSGGREKTIQYLIEQRLVDVNSTGKLRLQRGETRSASAAWAAAALNQINVLKYLAGRGANVAYQNEFGESLLDIACKLGHLEVVRYLVGSLGVTTETCNALGRTPFLTACAEGNVDLILYLIHAGADMSRTTVESGGTCLHACSFVCGRVEAIELLLTQGAEPGPNRHGFPPVLDAAAMGHEEAVEFWVKYYDLGQLDKAILVANALTLLGTAFWRKNREKAFGYFTRSIQEVRHKYKVPDTHFVPLPPIAEYGNGKEASTLEELQDLRVSNDPLALQRHCFMVRERILGPRHVTIARPCLTLTYFLAKIGFKEHVMPMWLHVLKRQVADFTQTGHSTLVYATLFTLGQSLHLPHIAGTVDPLPALEHCHFMVKSLGPSHRRGWVFVEITMHFLSLYLHFAKSHPGAADYVKLMSIVREFIDCIPRGPSGQTPLHYAVDARSTDLHLDSCLKMDVCDFPCVETTKCLLAAGMSPNVADAAGNMPLHVAAESASAREDPKHLEVIRLLLDSGSYTGARNASKATPLYLAGGNDKIKETLWKADCAAISLQRLAAGVVMNCRLTHEGIIPAKLSVFVNMH